MIATAEHPTAAAADPIEQALSVLRHTRDGNDLDPSHLALLEVVVNTGASGLTERGRSLWEKLVEDTASGNYKKPWLHGQEHLTKDHDGHVYWKGHAVEHFSYTGGADAEAEAEAARRLALACSIAEARSLTMGWPSVSNVYADLHFGQGVETPRIHVFWRVTNDGHRFKVIPEDSNDRVTVKLRSDKLKGDHHAEWDCDSMSLRHALICSQSDFKSCMSTLVGDMEWARLVLRSTKNTLPEQLHNAVQVNELMTEAKMWGLVAIAESQILSRHDSPQTLAGA